MKINTNNTEAMTEVLDRIQARASVRKLTADIIRDQVTAIEERLAEALNIPKKYWQGCKVVLTPSRPHSGYKGIPEGTFAEIVRGSGSWFLVGCYRKASGTQPEGRNSKTRLILTDEALAQVKDQE